jgi:hypothetical protein
VRQDFLANQGRSVTHCRFSLTQLQSATVTGKQGSKRIAVRGARVSFQGLRKTTDGRGRASITKLFRSAGTRTAGASYRGAKSATTSVRVRR